MSLHTTKKPRNPRSDRYQLVDFDRDVIRRTVNDMIENGKHVPIAKYILATLKDFINFAGKLTYLTSILKELGFVWRKCDSNRTVLMERSDVTVARLNYLRQIEKFRDEGRVIVYTDETYVHSIHSMKKCCQDSNVSMKFPFTRGERLIVVHAGCSSGFIKGADLLFKAHTSSGDYHQEMNWANFYKWLTGKLIPNLPPCSVVVVDNAAYHNVQEDKCPTQATKKADIISWMDRNNIKYSPDILKAELLELCKRSKPATKYILDSTLQQHGHDCLRLPQYHAELNAIELIWSQVKGRVAAANATHKFKDVLRLTAEALEAITEREWESCCRHVEGVEERFRLSNIAVERAVEEFIIAVSDEESTDTASDSEPENFSDTESAFETS